jgi:hypothetical protein
MIHKTPTPPTVLIAPTFAIFISPPWPSPPAGSVRLRAASWCGGEGRRMRKGVMDWVDGCLRDSTIPTLNYLSWVV